MVYCILKAFLYSEVSYLEIFRYVEIVFSAVMGYLFFYEIPKSNFYYGALLILLANLYLVFFKKITIKESNEL
jgi:drug/metabolite transporter (DMT)-like permease